MRPHFSEPEWDGKPVAPEEAETCANCGQRPCVSETPPPGPCPDAVADLGKPGEIGKVFAGFQKFLYQEVERRPAS